jgi:CysZ protein
MTKNQKSIIGIKYFVKGFSLCMNSSLRKFVLLPIIINILVTTIAMYFAFSGAYDLSDYLSNQLLPQWLSFLKWIISAILWLIICIVILYSFSSITLLIGSPLYSILAEKTEEILSGKPSQESSFIDIIKDIPHTIGLELLKFCYRIPLLLLNLIFLFVPIVGPLIIALISSWGCAMDYTSYGFENNKISYKDTRQTLSENKILCTTFGFTVWLMMLVPIINFIIVPVAVCGGTALWFECLRPKFEDTIQKNRTQLIK